MSARIRNRRAFTPGLGGALESRLLLSATSGVIPNYHIPPRPGFVGARTADHGHAVAINDVDGEIYVVNLLNGGTVRAIPRRGGIVDLVIDGSVPTSELTINPFVRANPRHTAHNFPLGTARRNGVLNIGNVTVTSGVIGSILGYQTANLNGTISVPGTIRVDRVAFENIKPGATIVTGGDLNTLDVYNNASFNTPNTGLRIGRDLNAVNVGGNLSITNGATFQVARDLGAFAQGAKGSGPAGQGIIVIGNFTAGTGAISVVRFGANRIFVEGTTTYV